MATALRTGQPVELTDQRTETGQVFANPDGTKTMEQHSLPVRVRKGRELGCTRPVVAAARPTELIRPVATISPLVLSAGGDQNLVSIGKPGAQIRLGWPTPLPKPVLSGNTATYPSVFAGRRPADPAEVDRFSQLLVVQNREAAANPPLRTLSFPISADGLNLTVEPRTAPPRQRTRPASSSTPPIGRRCGTRRVPRSRGSPSWPSDERRAADRDRPGSKLLTDPAAKYPLSHRPVDLRYDDQLAARERRVQPGRRLDLRPRPTRGQGRTAATARPDNVYRSMFLLGHDQRRPDDRRQHDPERAVPDHAGLEFVGNRRSRSSCGA